MPSRHFAAIFLGIKPGVGLDFRARAGKLEAVKYHEGQKKNTKKKS